MSTPTHWTLQMQMGCTAPTQTQRITANSRMVRQLLCTIIPAILSAEKQPKCRAQHRLVEFYQQMTQKPTIMSSMLCVAACKNSQSMQYRLGLLLICITCICCHWQSGSAALKLGTVQAVVSVRIWPAAPPTLAVRAARAASWGRGPFQPCPSWSLSHPLLCGLLTKCTHPSSLSTTTHVSLGPLRCVRPHSCDYSPLHHLLRGLLTKCKLPSSLSTSTQVSPQAVNSATSQNVYSTYLMLLEPCHCCYAHRSGPKKWTVRSCHMQSLSKESIRAPIQTMSALISSTSRQ